ncbi:hypothetical protein BRARA_H01769, partial [Brassica rapa]
MSNSASSSSRQRAMGGVPTQCWCGKNVATFVSKTEKNPYRRFYRCEIAFQRKTERHLFRWVDEAVIDEIGKVDAKHDELVNDVKDLRESMMERFKFQEKRLEKVEEEAMRVKMNEEMIESYDRI